MAGRLFGVSCPSPPSPDVLMADNDVITLGTLKLHVLFTPGHSPGHVCFHLPEQSLLFGVDMIFQNSIGPSTVLATEHNSHTTY